MKFQFMTRPHVEYDESLNSVKIVRAAKRVFVRDGGAMFSARRVAKEAKVSLGALQHFFPTKRDLLSAMLEFTVSQYDVAYQKVFGKLPVNGRTRLLGVIDLLVQDIWNADTRQFFFGFWALACHNDDAADLKDEMYGHYVERLAGFIGAADPAISEARAREIALQLAAMIEGLMLFAGSSIKQVGSREQMSKMVQKSVLILLSDSEIGSEQRRKSAR